VPFATNGGVRIHYELDGNGPPLVLQHGFLQSGRDWYRAGYVDALRTRRRLILIDARGHGASDKPHEPSAYTGLRMASDVVAVLDELGLPSAEFWGYSMGARIGYMLMHAYAARISAFILGGFAPLLGQQEHDPLEAEDKAQFIALARRGMAALADEFGITEPAWRAELLALDPEALIASRTAYPDTLDFAPLLSRVDQPCLLYAGSQDEFHDGMQVAAERMPNAAFLSLPGITHEQAFARSDLVLPAVLAFLGEHARTP
jgi:pimeloyl-ACP methyl ester carboxylesterase